MAVADDLPRSFYSVPKAVCDADDEWRARAEIWRRVRANKTKLNGGGAGLQNTKPAGWHPAGGFAQHLFR